MVPLPVPGGVAYPASGREDLRPRREGGVDKRRRWCGLGGLLVIFGLMFAVAIGYVAWVVGYTVWSVGRVFVRGVRRGKAE